MELVSVKNHGLAKAMMGVALAATLVLGMAPTSALAADWTGSAGAVAMSTTNSAGQEYVTGAASRAAMPITEILGISGVEETGNFMTFDDPLNVTGSNTSSKYVLMGTSANSAANPYFWNLNAKVYNKVSVSSSDVVVYNASRNGGGSGPDAALDVVADGESVADLDDSDYAVWQMLPDIIIGDGNAVDYSTTATLVAAAMGISTTYEPESVNYSFSTNESMIGVMYDTAEAAEAVVSASNGTKVLRYGSAWTIACKYENFIKGTQGYVLSQLEEDDEADKKTVAVVSDYNASNGEYTLVQSGIGEGTASTNRALEALEVVCDSLGTSEKTTATASELKGCDAIIVSGQNVGSTSGMSQDDLAEQIEGDTGMTPYTATSSAGAMYGTTMNSVENAQNISRLIGFVYPEYVSQVDFTAYYYEMFYHISSLSLASVMSGEMDGKVALESAETWAPTSSYSSSEVQAKIDAGCAYITDNASSVSSVLLPYNGSFNANMTTSSSSDSE